MWLTLNASKEKVYKGYLSLFDTALKTCQNCLEFEPATDEFCKREILVMLERIQGRPIEI